MMLLVDESVDRPIVERLRQDAHDCVYIAELSPSINDDQVLQEANIRNALLLTEDKDFGELVYRLGRVHGGVVLSSDLPVCQIHRRPASCPRCCKTM